MRQLTLAAVPGIKCRGYGPVTDKHVLFCSIRLSWQINKSQKISEFFYYYCRGGSSSKLSSASTDALRRSSVKVPYKCGTDFLLDLKQ